MERVNGLRAQKGEMHEYLTSLLMVTEEMLVQINVNMLLFILEQRFLSVYYKVP